MLPSLLVAAAVTAPAAPIPKDTTPNTTGPAPRVLAVKADGSGAVWVTATVYQKQKIQQQFVTVENGKQVVKQQEIEQMMSHYIRKSIGDFGGKFTTADGQPLTTEEVTRRVKDGAAVLVSSDGQPVSAGWLRAVAPDTVVMLTDELARAHFHFQNGSGQLPATAAPRMALLGTDDAGTVRLPVNPNAANQNNGQVFYDDFGGPRFRGRIVAQNIDVVDGSDSGPAQPAKPAGSDGKKALEDVRFDAYDVTGKMIPRSAALARLKAGGLVVLAGDNRFPDAQYLTPFRGQDELLVLVSAELTFPVGTPNPYDASPKPAPAADPAKPQPAELVPAPIVRPAPILRPGVKQVQIQIEK